MDIKLHIRSGGHRVSYDIIHPTTKELDNLIVQKTAEFLAMINQPDEDSLNVPPAYQLPVMRGRIRK